MPVMPLDFAAAHVAIKAWVDSQIAVGGALVGFAAAPYTVIWGHQDGPRPALPYAVLWFARPLSSIGGKAARELVDGVGDEVTSRDEYDAEMILRVELLSRAALSPTSGMSEVHPILTGLEASLHTSRQVEDFSAAGLAFVDVVGPTAIPMVVGFGHERRAYLDVIFRARVRVDVADVPVLDSASIDDLQATSSGGDADGSVGST